MAPSTSPKIAALRDDMLYAYACATHFALMADVRALAQRYGLTEEEVEADIRAEDQPPE